MKIITIAFLSLFMLGCTGEATLDTSSEAAFQESGRAIAEALPEEKKDVLGKAIMYFAMGGIQGFQGMMRNAFSGEYMPTPNESDMRAKIGHLDGLTADEIIAKYHKEMAEENIKIEKQRDERANISALEDEASKLLESAQFEQALDKYQSMGRIESGVTKAEEGIAETTHQMNEFAEMMAYVDKVEITEFVTKRIDTYTSESLPGVRISLKNQGDRSLDKVKVIVYFKDVAGNVIYEEDFHPVLVSEYSFSGDNKPLKPGYVKEMKQGSYFTLDTPLSEWEEGSATVKIVGLEFSE